MADWLIPRPENANIIAALQPVSQAATDRWTRNFDEAAEWLRSGEQRRLTAFGSGRRRGDTTLQPPLL